MAALAIDPGDGPRWVACCRFREVSFRKLVMEHPVPPRACTSWMAGLGGRHARGRLEHALCLHRAWYHHQSQLGKDYLLRQIPGGCGPGPSAGRHGYGRPPWAALSARHFSTSCSLGVSSHMKRAMADGCQPPGTRPPAWHAGILTAHQ